MSALYVSLSSPFSPSSISADSATCRHLVAPASSSLPFTSLSRRRRTLRPLRCSGVCDSESSTCRNLITAGSISVPFTTKTTLSESLSHRREPIGCGGGVSLGEDYVVVNFYHFVSIEDPADEVSNHLSFLQGLDVRGRIYINQQGINAQYSGPPKDALAYVKWLREDQKFFNILFQISPALSGHAFPRLKLHYKPSLVQVEGGTANLPLQDPSMRATPLSPSEWRQKLKGVHRTDEMSTQNSSTSILLDVRNGYEWDIGHFHGAQRPNVDCFRSTSFGTSQLEADASDPLANVDKERTDILMYCTGGIRCDVYSAMLRQRGFKNLYTLKGGVSHYLENEGPAEWVGNLFVFDSRLSLPPSTYKPEVTSETWGGTVPKNSSFAKCYICGSQISELRHRNCANLDCNLLFLCCSDCVNDVKGCCCVKCTHAARRRPVLPGHQRYQKWHNYRDMGLRNMADHQT